MEPQRVVKRLISAVNEEALFSSFCEYVIICLTKLKGKEALQTRGMVVS